MVQTTERHGAAAVPSDAPAAIGVHACALDVYAGHLGLPRGLGADERLLWRTWVTNLNWRAREETLFELEALLKGLACFSNPRNQSGPSPDPGLQDRSAYLRVFRDTLQHCIDLAKRLLGRRDRTFSFSRYLESVLPSDEERVRLLEQQLSQQNPEASLFSLRNGLTHLIEVADGLLESGFVTARLFEAMRSLVARELARSTYFSPTLALEFRLEHDRIAEPALLDLIDYCRTQLPEVHSAVVLAFLTLQRDARYLDLISEMSRFDSDVRLTLPLFAALRSDLRALAAFLGRQTGDAMADAFELHLMAHPSSRLSRDFSRLMHRGAHLVSLRATFANLAHALSLDLKRIFHDILPNANELHGHNAQPGRIAEATRSLSGTLEHSLQSLSAEICPGAPLPRLSAQRGADRARSERLRREIWMFQQVLRAFIAKARAGTDASDTWAPGGSFGFIQEFLRHFRAIGLQLILISDFDRIATFLDALENLRDPDLHDARRLELVTQECALFLEYLNTLFAEVSKRSVLQGVPFDREGAAQTLKMHLQARP